MKGKHCKKLHWNKNRMVCAVLCAVLLITAISFSSMAWLTYEKQEVQQVFKGTTLEIELGGANGEYPLVPGAKYTIPEDKVPKIIVPNNNVDCYVFVVADYIWHDLTYYDSEKSSFIRPIDVMTNTSRLNDNFVPDRGGDSGNDDDFGYVKLDTSVVGQNGISRQIHLNGKWIGQRHIYVTYTFEDPTKTPTTFNSTDEFSSVFKTKTSGDPRFLYILEGNSKNCCLQVADGISKVEMLEEGSAYFPKIRFTVYTVQAEGLSQKDAYGLVLSDTKVIDENHPFNYNDEEGTEPFEFK